ncbi:FecR family protein [Hyphomicrobium methylovorum]|uniref:FecR family protein n=1 Tax=Hyphomicrobium methylovorum TaxID=84 RepID=UPI001FE61AFB|nr:FecR family protein [Hyphomicrobium methylovorum]
MIAVGFPALHVGGAQAASGDRIGDAVIITNIVMADFAEKQRKLANGDDVRQDEVIEVNTDAQGEFRLDDDTKLALGPGSRLVLDKFVYDSEKKTGSIIINMTKGAFRFITGIAAKPTYVINTPNASITVRGTVFDVYILPDKSVWLLLHEGALEATGKRNVCHVLEQPGQLVHIASDGTVSKPVNWSQLPDNTSVQFDTAFPFVINAPSVDPKPLLTRASIVDGAFPPSQEKACLNPHPRFQIRKPDSAPRNAVPKKKKDAKKSKPTRTAKRPRNDDDDWGNGARGMDIVVGGGGMGGFRPGGMRGGGGNMGPAGGRMGR